MRYEFDQLLKEDQKKQIEEGNQQKKAIDEENLKKLQEKMKENELEVSEVAKQQLDRMSAKTEQLKVLDEQHAEEMSRLKSMAEKKVKKTREQMISDAKIAHDSWRENYNAEVEKLEEQNRVLKEAQDKLIKIVSSGTAIRTQMQEEHDEKTVEQTKKHIASIHSINEETDKFLVEKQKEMLAMAEKARLDELELTNRKIELQSIQLNSSLALLQTMASVSSHDEFRAKCEELIMHYNAFYNACSAQMQPLILVEMGMRRQKKLESSPKFNIALKSIDTFLTLVQDFRIPEKFKEKYEEPLNKVLSILEEMQASFVRVQESTKEYAEIFETTPNVMDEAKSCYKTVKKESEEIKTAVSGLRKLMKIFEISASKEVGEEVVRQVKAWDSSIRNSCLEGSSGLKQLDNK